MSPIRRLGIAVAIGAAGMATVGIMRGPNGTRSASAQTAPTPTPTATPGAIVPSAPAATPSAGPGRDLYLRDCAWCHGAQGEGSVYGPPLIGVGAASADFMLSTGRMPIPQPEAQPEHRAPAYTREQIRQLVEFVAALGGGPAIPSVDPNDGSIGQGAQLYEENCASCHGSVAAGGALTQGIEAPPLTDSTPLQIAEAIRLGGAGFRTGKMPKFGPDLLNDHEVNSIVRYVLDLQHPDDRGGQNLGHLGPIPEGLVAWLIGLLALIVVIRWIGETR
jgi:ubiquinol-cytochrome c reductase cytochrome c subunit